MMGIMSNLAEAFRYPAAGQLEVLENSLESISDRRISDPFSAFVNHIGALSLGEWEELYTRTLDLSPAVAPYIGFQVWGEGYQRGNFLAQMNRAIQEAGVDPQGELADHLQPVLRYLEVTDQPLPVLVDALVPALKRMRAVLRKAEPANPYNYLFEAVWQSIDRHKAVKSKQPLQPRFILQESVNR